jgi:opacity protein-like surface antigen
MPSGAGRSAALGRGVAGGDVRAYSQITVHWLLLAALAVLALASSAQADDVVVPVQVRPGTLALAPVAVVARGTQVSVTIVDARGKGAGWSMLARSTGRSFDSAVVTGAQIRCGPRSTCTLPRSTVRYPVVVNRFRPAVVLGALRGTGMGTISVTLRLARAPRLGAGLNFVVRSS